MTYKQLPIIEVGLDNLLLDLENYRIPTRRDDEAGALSYLFASEDVLGAARMILRDGYFDNEVPIVMPAGTPSDDSRYVVVEGNRRVSALKALQNPTVTPGHEAEIRSLLKRYAVEAESLPKRVRVIVAPDRATAAPHVARLHTGMSKRRWSRDQQATFYYSLLKDQTSVEDVKAQYPGVEVTRFMKMAVVRRFLTGARFSDHSLRQYASSPELTMSAFEYAYRNKDIATAIGVEFDKEGLLIPRTSTPENIALRLPGKQLSALEYLVGEFRAGRLNTRSPEFKKRDQAYQLLVNRLTSFPETAAAQSIATAPVSAPVLKSHSVSTALPPETGQGVRNREQFSPEAADNSGIRGSNHPDTKDKLDLTGLEYDNAPNNLKMRYFELRKISLSNLPIAAAILMRSVLEATIKVHFEASEAAATGDLKAAFKRVSESYGHEKSLMAAINTVQSAPAEKPGSISWFNLITHSADALVNADEVRQAWKVVNPLLRRLLRPPSNASGTTR